MDFSNPGLLISGLAISIIGLALFVHGKGAENYRNLGIGLVMMGLPIMIHSLLWLWVVALAGVAAVFFLPDGS